MESLHNQDERKIFSVSELTEDIKNLLEDNFATLWISGEISNLKVSQAGHAYFSLKDQDAQISAVMFRMSLSRLKFDLEDGQQIIVHGRVSVYSQRGQYQIILDYAEPEGMGALQLAFEQLKKKLEAEGIFDAAHKKAIPLLPKSIGLITSSKGAAMHDVIQVTQRRFPSMSIIIHPVKVQGEGAALEIAEAIHSMNQMNQVDVLIVGRGGGSLEDLWAFNEEVVVRAIARSAIPIISAVGHETDFTLADFVADVRAPTPSAAAELAVPDKHDLASTILNFKQDLFYILRNELRDLRNSLKSLKKRIRNPRQILEDQQIRTDDLVLRATRAMQTQLAGCQYKTKVLLHRLPDLKNYIVTKSFKVQEHEHALLNAMQVRLHENQVLFQKINNTMPNMRLKIGVVTKRWSDLSQRLQGLSPMGAFSRGFSILRDTQKLKIIRSIEEIALGDRLEVILMDGKLDVLVSTKEKKAVV